MSGQTCDSCCWVQGMESSPLADVQTEGLPCYPDRCITHVTLIDVLPMLYSELSNLAKNAHENILLDVIKWITQNSNRGTKTCFPVAQHALAWSSLLGVRYKLSAIEV